ncbi:MAG: autotransporter outer membrane beta-barrel domain-containing protein, partial [Alphaproteobacteria bacterium]|nr:autotransporter outer membrane beta-barrel domain-containing protein [Alphaproteobacteria bacterium]
NEGKVELTNTTITDNIINNGTLDIKEGVALGTVTGTGIMNVNADYVLSAAVSGNTVNVNGVKISGADNLAADTTLNVIGGTLDLGNQVANVKTASFDANSSLLLSINSLSDYGHLVAQNISVAEGAKLQATLAQGLVNIGETASLQLLTADNSDFNNFADSFDNKMYHFEKADKNGKYNISLTKTAEDVVLEDGGAKWVAGVAKAYVDSNTFESGTVGSDIANKLAALAQNDADALISEIKRLAPSESPVIHDHVMNDSSRLFRAVDSYFPGYRDPIGVSAGDVFSDVSIWAKPYIGKSKVSTGDVFEKQKSYNKGIIAGIQKKIIPNLDIGFGLHYDESKIDMYKRDLDVDTVIGFVYGEYKFDNWFVNMLTSYGLSDYDEERSALETMYKASYDVYTTTLATTIGYQFKNLIPEVGMRYYHVRRRGYKDSADQYVHKSNTNYARAVAGVRYTQDFGKISPEVYMGLSYDVKSPNDNTFIDLSNGSSYIVRGESLPRLGCEFSLGLNTYLGNNLTLGTSLMGAYRKDYQEYTGIVRLRYDF